ncbi:unnamed protein product, partial [Meganyctiphanes norvegica]
QKAKITSFGPEHSLYDVVANAYYDNKIHSAFHKDIDKGILMSLKGMTSNQSNPLRCDCELVWLREYLQERDAKGVGTEPFLGNSLRGVPVCASPDEYKGIPISE